RAGVPAVVAMLGTGTERAVEWHRPTAAARVAGGLRHGVCGRQRQRLCSAAVGAGGPAPVSARYYFYEQDVLAQLEQRLSSPLQVDDAALAEVLNVLFPTLPAGQTDWQKVAAATAC